VKRYDLIKHDGQLVQVMAVTDQFVTFRYLDGGCDAVPIESVELIQEAKAGEPVTRATFRTYWEDAENTFACYNLEITLPDGSVQHTDASVQTLVKEGVRVPFTPAYATWRRDVLRLLRCKHCPQRLRGTKNDWNNHAEYHRQKMARLRAAS
jgi:hypothetical protein